MKSLQDNIFTGFIILILVSLSVAYKCPDDCLCSTITTTITTTTTTTTTTSDNDERLLNHVKCSTLNGLTGEEKIRPVHSLDLSNANLNRISHSLEKLKDVINLNLSYNNLSEIGRLSKRLKTLILNNNKITSGKLWRIPNHIENIDLSFNEITYLPLELTKLKNLRKIELTGNIINCTCETLEVRNWFQHNHVWTDNIICTYPNEIKGQSWLQVKQSDICKDPDGDEISTKDHTNKKSLNDNNENENELMLSDQAVVNEGSGDNDNDELGKTFLIVSKNSNKSNKKFERMIMDDHQGPGGELGSGEIDDNNDDEIEQQDEQIKDDEDDNDDEDGSGSGLGPIVIPLTEDSDSHKQHNNEYDDDVDDDGIHDELVTTDDDHHHLFEENEEQKEGDIFGGGLGIARFDDDNMTTTTELIPSTTTDELIVPVVYIPAGALPPHLTTTVSPSSTIASTEQQLEEEDVVKADKNLPVYKDGSDDSVKNAGIKLDENNAIKEAGVDENNNNTYIL